RQPGELVRAVLARLRCCFLPDPAPLRRRRPGKGAPGRARRRRRLGGRGGPRARGRLAAGIAPVLEADGEALGRSRRSEFARPSLRPPPRGHPRRDASARAQRPIRTCLRNPPPPRTLPLAL